MLTAGITGLPNVGKSILFNAVTRSRKAQAANSPFCAIGPDMGIVNVPDPRLDVLAALSKPEKVVSATIEFVDIAGLVRGASEGEGLGNQFLSRIREVDAVVQALRCFKSADIHHVSGSIDPGRDIEVVNTELILADLASLQKRWDRLEKDARGGKSAGIMRGFWREWMGGSREKFVNFSLHNRMRSGVGFDTGGGIDG